MKNMMKKVSVLLMALVIVLSLAVPAFAVFEDSKVQYVGGAENFVFVVDENGEQLAPHDLFVEFKDVIPGDKLTQTVIVSNTNSDSDYVRLYLRALPHDETKNPLNITDETIKSMKEFLREMNMEIVNVDRNNEVIFSGTADQWETKTESIYLGGFVKGEETELKVTLDVPVDMGDEFQNRMGELDWVFIAEQFNYPAPDDTDDDDETYKVTVKKVWKDGNSKSRPESIKVRLTRKDKTVDTVTLTAKNNWRYTWRDLGYKSGWDVEEIKVPKGYDVSYDENGRVFTITNTAELEATGQLNWPIPVLAVAGVLLVATGASLLRKGRKNA